MRLRIRGGRVRGGPLGRASKLAQFQIENVGHDGDNNNLEREGERRRAARDARGGRVKNRRRIGGKARNKVLGVAPRRRKVAGDARHRAVAGGVVLRASNGALNQYLADFGLGVALLPQTLALRVERPSWRSGLIQVAPPSRSFALSL